MHAIREPTIDKLIIAMDIDRTTIDTAKKIEKSERSGDILSSCTMQMCIKS